MALIGYARVSTKDQNLDGQLDMLRAAGCERIFQEKMSGALLERPEFGKLEAFARSGDTVVVTKLDRVGRSLRNLVNILADWEERGVNIKTLDGEIDTTTAVGRLFTAIRAAFAAYEREQISERTKAGLAAARARGRNGGRPRKVTPAKLEQVRRMRADRTHTMQEISAVVGLSCSTLYRHLGDSP